MFDQLWERIKSFLDIRTSRFHEAEREIDKALVQLFNQAKMNYEKDKTESKTTDTYWWGVSEGLRLSLFNLGRMGLPLSERLWVIANDYNKTDDGIYFLINNVTDEFGGQGSWRVPAFDSKEAEKRFYEGAHHGFKEAWEAIELQLPKDFCKRDVVLRQISTNTLSTPSDGLNYIIDRSKAGLKLQEENKKVGKRWTAPIRISDLEENWKRFEGIPPPEEISWTPEMDPLLFAELLTDLPSDLADAAHGVKRYFEKFGRKYLGYYNDMEVLSQMYKDKHKGKSVDIFGQTGRFRVYVYEKNGKVFEVHGIDLAETELNKIELANPDGFSFDCSPVKKI